MALQDRPEHASIEAVPSKRKRKGHVFGANQMLNESARVRDVPLARGLSGQLQTPVAYCVSTDCETISGQSHDLF